MRELFTVKKWEPAADYHIVENKNGDMFRVDLMVDGGYEGKPEDLVGKKVMADLVPFILVGSFVEVAE